MIAVLVTFSVSFQCPVSVTVREKFVFKGSCSWCIVVNVTDILYVVRRPWLNCPQCLETTPVSVYSCKRKRTNILCLWERANVCHWLMFQYQESNTATLYHCLVLQCKESYGTSVYQWLMLQYQEPYRVIVNPCLLLQYPFSPCHVKTRQTLPSSF